MRSYCQKSLLFISSVAVLSLLLVLPVWGQFGPAPTYVSWSSTLTPSSVDPGSSARLLLSAEVAEGWKLYALDSPRPSRALSVRMEALPPGVSFAEDWKQSDPSTEYDPNFKTDVRYFRTAFDIWNKVSISEAAQGGQHQFVAVTNFVICHDESGVCLPPSDMEVNVELEISGPTAGANSTPRSADPTSIDSAGASENASALPSFVTSGRDATIAPTTGGGDDNSSIGDSLKSSSTISDAVVDSGDEPGSTSQRSGMWAFILLAAGAGLAALLTPCVFPMIPLTVSYFTKHSGNHRESVRMALIYGLAIIVTFTGLGILMALLVGAAGAQSFAANPWVNLFIGAIFILFALSLLGLFELRLPSGLVNFFNRQSSEKGGYVGVLFMGFTLTLVSFSCTAPFVGGLLAATAGGAWSYPILGMVIFSATFSLPFIFFALFPRALSSLPASGSWMNAVKVVLGFVELAAALKFLSNADLVWGWGIISRPLAIALIVVIFFLAGIYLIGKLPLKHETPLEHVGVGRLLFAIGFFGLSIYMLPGLLGAPLNTIDAYLPPRQASDVSLLALTQRGEGTGLPNEEAWHTDDLESALAQAEREGKPLFIDFTGYTCTNCRDMEANVFTKQAIAELFETEFVLLRLYTDGPRDREFQNYQLKLTGTVALPTYAILNPYDPQVPITKISGTVPVDRFETFLSNGKMVFSEQVVALNAD